jgi:hypothetical protein
MPDIPIARRMMVKNPSSSDEVMQERVCIETLKLFHKLRANLLVYVSFGANSFNSPPQLGGRQSGALRQRGKQEPGHAGMDHFYDFNILRRRSISLIRWESDFHCRFERGSGRKPQKAIRMASHRESSVGYGGDRGGSPNQW